MQLKISVISVSQSEWEYLEAGGETFPAVLENTSGSEVWLQLLWELKLLPAFSQRGCSVFAEQVEAGGVCSSHFFETFGVCFRIWVSPYLRLSVKAWLRSANLTTCSSSSWCSLGWFDFRRLLLSSSTAYYISALPVCQLHMTL